MNKYLSDFLILIIILFLLHKERFNSYAIKFT